MAVLTAAPEDVLPLPALASELMAALRAELLLAVAAAVAAELEAAFAEPPELLAAAVTVPAGAFEVCGAGGAAAGRRHVDVAQRRRILRVARIDFHDDVVLIDRAVDDRDLALAECIVKRIVDLRRRDAEPRGGVAVDDEIGFQALLLLVGVDVGQSTRLCSSAWTSFGVQVKRSSALSDCSVYWYCELLWRPPARMSWTGNRNSRPPGTWASFGRSRAIT